MANGRPTTILFLAANPINSDALRLGAEVREIEAAFLNGVADDEIGR